MNMHSKHKDSLSLNLFVGGNSPDADLSGTGVRPLAAFKVEANTGGLGGQEFRQPKKLFDSPCFLSVVAS